MARHRTFYSYRVPITVFRLVQSLCADFKRERGINASGNGTAFTGLVCDGVSKALERQEQACREPLLSDISNGFGYDRSYISGIMSKGAYYRRKRQLVYDIAVNLGLIRP